MEPWQPESRALGLAAALAVARAHGLAVTAPEILRDRSNLLARLRPYPLVARVATRTGELRPGGGLAWLQREVALLEYLAAVDAPAVRPSPLLPPGPHLYRGLALTFMEYVEHTPARLEDFGELGQRLRALHAALAGFPGELPRLAIIPEMGGWLARLTAARALPPADLALLQNFHARALGLLGLDLPVQALHGDAHSGNLLLTPRGPLWIDFEDSCSGPVEWDLACLVAADIVLDGGAQAPLALAAYGGPAAHPALDAFIEARALEMALWSALMLPERPALAGYYAASLAWLRSRRA